MKKKIITVVLIIAMVATLCFTLIACKPDEPKFKIGVLHINPLNSTEGYTHAHQQGIIYMKNELGLKDSQIMYKDSLVDTDPNKINAAIEELIAAGCNMIIGTSFGYGDEMQNYAKTNPQIIFSHGTGYLDTFGEGKNNNMNTYFGRIYQARYLSGIVAGLKASQGAHIGYVSAFGTDIAETSSGINSFALGVQSVNPTAIVDVKCLNSWFDPANEAQYAKDLMTDYKCEIIAQHSDTMNPSNEAKLAGKFSIGYNTDMAAAIRGENEERNPSVLTSVTWNWGVYYKIAVQAAMKCFDEQGVFTNTSAWQALGNYYGSYADGLFGLSQLSTACNADTQAILNAATSIMKQGTTAWDVFTNKALSFAKNADGTFAVNYVDRPLVDANGNAVTVKDANITGDMHYWIKGVNGPAEKKD